MRAFTLILGLYLISVSEAIAQNPENTEQYCDVWVEAQSISRDERKITYVVVGQTSEYSNEDLRRGFGKLFMTSEEGIETSLGLVDLKSFGANEIWPRAKVYFFANGRPFKGKGFSFHEAIEEVPKVVRLFNEDREKEPIDNVDLLQSSRRMQFLNTRILCNLDRLEVNLFRQTANRQLLRLLENGGSGQDETVVSELMSLSGVGLYESQEELIKALKQNDAFLQEEIDTVNELFD